MHRDDGAYALGQAEERMLESSYVASNPYPYFSLAYNRNVSDRVFLLDPQDLISYALSNKNQAPATPTTQAISNSTFRTADLSASKTWSYWVSTPDHNGENKTVSRRSRWIALYFR